ncbi:IPT/TIG domain-containing protein [Anaeromyxobacter oryzae]|uniref:IPT/TIG domain-containing protein n=1 Tax=Anaeromyxobacter oryzae TaxID=2918170 RepID=UPI0020BE1C04|nr:IPT/TIG domain-containing protein [Anaeromyxobacter oryzae]
MSSRSFSRSVVASAVALLSVVLAACGANAGSGDWYYHFACNGDYECLTTNALGTTSGTIDVGPRESDCRSLELFAEKFWGPAAWNTCDQNPTYTPPGQGTPSITSVSPSAAVPGTQVTITGTNFPTSPGDVTLDIGGVTVPTTAGISTTSTTITFTIPNIASLSGPITVHTPGGTATSAGSLTILDSLHSVAWSGTKFLAVGDYGTALTSADGVHWATQVTGVNPLIVSLTSAAWSGSSFLAGGTNGYLLSSPDGVTWTLPAQGLGMMAFNGIASSGSQFVAAGSQGAIARSTDGSSWTASLNYPSDLYNAIVWANGQFVLTGYAILTSPDGVTWTTRVPQATPYYAIAWSGTTFAAVGAGGAVRTSPDGVTWTVRTSGTASNLRGVTWFKGQFVAVGDGGTVLTSPDGITWTARTSGISTNLNAIAASATTAVAVGKAGVTVSSSDGIGWTSLLPPPPTGVSGTHEVGQSTITWSPVAGATSYVVYVSTSGSVSKTSYFKRVTSAGTSATVTGLNSQGWWYAIVTAVNAYGEGAPSAAAPICVGTYICG